MFKYMLKCYWSMLFSDEYKRSVFKLEQRLFKGGGGGGGADPLNGTLYKHPPTPPNFFYVLIRSMVGSKCGTTQSWCGYIRAVKFNGEQPEISKVNTQQLKISMVNIEKS